MASRVRIERTGTREYTVHAPDNFRVHIKGGVKDAIKRAEQLARAQEKLGFHDVVRSWVDEGIADKRKAKKGGKSVADRKRDRRRSMNAQRKAETELFMEAATGHKGVPASKLPKAPKLAKAPKTFNPFESKLVRARMARVTNAEAAAAFATIGGIKKGDVIKTHIDDYGPGPNGDFSKAFTLGFGGNEFVRVDSVRKFKDSHRTYVAVVGRAQRGKHNHDVPSVYDPSDKKYYIKTQLIIPLEFIYNLQQAGKGSKYRPDHEGFYVLEKARGGGAKLLDRAALDKMDAVYRAKNKPWWKFWK